MAAWELWQQLDTFGAVAWDWYELGDRYHHEAMVKKLRVIMAAIATWRQHAQG
jgi:hypothetical protein